MGLGAAGDFGALASELAENLVYGPALGVVERIGIGHRRQLKWAERTGAASVALLTHRSDRG